MSIRKGNAWRRAIVNTLTRHGHRTQVRGLGYPGDDITVPGTRPALSIEAKNWKSTDLAGWVDQAERQCPPLSLPVVWAHRRGKADPEDGYVVMTGRAFLRLIEELT